MVLWYLDKLKNLLELLLDTVISWSVDSQGNEIQEKVAQVQADAQTNRPGWIATKVDEQANIIIDNNGHKEDLKYLSKFQTILF